jgi:hypothetical protein
LDFFLIFFSFVRSVTVVTVDEHMNAYQPTGTTKKKSEEKQEPIPVVFIPRKPHPNGLLVYILSSFFVHPV